MGGGSNYVLGAGNAKVKQLSSRYQPDFSGESTPLGFGNHFGIRSRDRPGAGDRFGCRSTALRLASLAFAPFRASQSPRGKNTKRNATHLFLFLSRPAH